MFKTSQMKKVHLFSVILLTVLLPVKKADCIPAFARKYQISCQVCHAPAFPRLKEFGDEFAGNGFRMDDYESPRYFVPVGDDRLSLFRELPLAIRIDGFATYNFNKEGKTDFSSPFVMKILSGGEISDKISYYFYFLMNEGGTIAGVEDAFLMFHDLFRSGINFYIGQFQVSDPLYKGELRYTLEPYRIYAAAPGNSSVNLKYDRGIMFDRSFSTGTELFLEVLNGYGLNGALDDVFDHDKYKNLMLRIFQSAGPVGIGAFGYAGKERLFLGFPDGVNTMWMAGPDIALNLNDRFIMNIQYVFRNDSHVLTGFGVRNDVKTQGGFMEVIYSPKGDMSKWYLTGLLNMVESDDDILDYSAATVHFGYIIRRNLRLVAEYTRQFSGEEHGRVNAGFVSAF